MVPSASNPAQAPESTPPVKFSAMKQALHLGLRQSLTMTPQLQQAIRLLQLSALELNLEIQSALESNMMLEAVETEEALGHGDGENGADLAEMGLTDFSSPVSEAEKNGSTETITEDIPEDLPVDSGWDDIYDAPLSLSGAGNTEGSDFEPQRSAAETLKDHLLWQLNLAPIQETDKAIALAIIDALNPDGYLTCPLEDVRETLGQDIDMQAGLDEIEAVLHWVQNLDPPGIAARDLGECLSLQLAQLDAGMSWLKEAKALVANHLNLLGNRDYTQLARRMKLGREELQKVIALIQSLNPKPGASFQETPVEYVVPDVYVLKRRGSWHVELNVDAIPHLRVNPGYANLVRRADSTPDNLSLKTHLQEAKWFIKSLQSRSETLLRVATAIVERQRAFLEHGPEAMKPLVLHDIAESLEMHESTISRVTTRKYMHTPRGIFELKFFFSSHVGTQVGGECSSTAVRAVIKKMVSSEDPRKPLSDSKIAAVFSEKGINVARRTVAKYREAMGIPPSNERKRLV
jgi:RNA polymerase sigma-54 factor